MLELSTGQPLAGGDLRRALDGMAVRTQAVGALMAECGISADDAYDQLADRARETGLPVTAVAHQVVAPYTAPGDGYPGADSQVG